MPQSFTTSFLRRNLLFAFLLLFISNSTLHAQGDPAELRSVWSNPEADPKDRIQSWLELSLLLTNDNEQYGILMEMVQLGAEPESEFRNYALLSEGIVNQFFIRNMTEAESKWLQLLNEDDSAFVASATYFLIGMKEGEEKSALIESLVAYVLRTSQEHMPVIPFVGPIDALAFAVSEEEAKADQDKLFAHYSSVIEYQIKIGDNEKAMQSAIQAGDGMWRWLREKEQATGFYQQGLQLAKEDPKFSLFKDQLKQRILAVEKGSSVRKAVKPAVVRQVQAVHSGPVQPIEISRKSFDRSKYDLHKVDSVIGITGDTTWRSEMLPPVETMAEIDTFILGLPQKTRALPPVFSENGTHNFQYLWADQGLPDGIGGIQQDPLGNIWIVSTNALTRYDGEYFYSYTVNEGMPDILLDRFLIDSKGVIWISVEGGLLKYDGHQLLWYKNLICQFIFEDLEGNIWTSKQMSQVGLTRIEEDRYFNYSQGQGLAARINSIAQAPDGSYWITSDNTGVFRMDSTSIVQYNHKHGLIDWRAQEVVVTSDGSVWMSIFSVQNNRMGLHQIKNGNLYSWDSEWGLSMRHMIKDSQDQIWMMNGNFLMSFDGKT
ncbi:MAG: hypothetical protein N4A46_11585, partial [Schleiferiaceae bacterium]|nr:hypothetical protein [Schleiferiaceae bacterium]